MQESVVYQKILEEGVQKGRQEGIQIGVERVKEEGTTKARAIIAKNSLSIGIPIEQVAIATELTLADIQQLIID